LVASPSLFSNPNAANTGTNPLRFNATGIGDDDVRRNATDEIRPLLDRASPWINDGTDDEHRSDDAIIAPCAMATKSNPPPATKKIRPDPQS
jgi:hypothetical protein